MRSAALLKRASEVVPGGVHSARRRTDPPFCVRRAYGQFVEDLDRNRYIDYRAGGGAVILGHANSSVDKRVGDTLRRGALFGVGTTEDETLLAETIVRHIPSVEQVLFCNSGSEATYHALRLARAVTGRTHIIKFQGCYHGFHDLVLLNCESTPDLLGKMDPHSAGMGDEIRSVVHICRYNDLDDVARTFHAWRDCIAAVIVEPIAHNGPGILPKPGFLEGLRTSCSEAGALLIFDEIITGYRHSLGGYQTIAGVLPDLTVLGKALANGYPLAVLGGRTAYMEHFMTRPGGDTFWAGTYNANGVSVAAALATLDQLEHGDVYNHIFELGDIMRNGLADLVSQKGIPATVSGYGSLFSLWFVPGPIRSYDDVAQHDLARFLEYRAALLRRGVFEYPSTDGARSHIGASHTIGDIERSLDAARKALVEIAR